MRGRIFRALLGYFVVWSTIAVAIVAIDTQATNLDGLMVAASKVFIDPSVVAMSTKRSIMGDSFPHRRSACESAAPPTRDRKDPMPIDSELRYDLDRLLAAPRLLVASDFDGVIAPIVDRPDLVEANPITLAALRSLAERPDTEVAVVSGRSLAFLRSLPGLPATAWLAGSHGSEFGHRPETVLTPAARGLLDHLVQDLERLASTTPGTIVEPQATGVAFHYRMADPALGPDLRSVILDGLGALPGVEVKLGKMVVELAVFTATKGTALDILRVDSAVDAVLFVGDDVTDEDAFARLGADDLGIKVGDGPTLATRRIADPDAVAELLRHLAATRSAQP
jgi:trehalose 6-phosphate phosphatase